MDTCGFFKNVDSVTNIKWKLVLSISSVIVDDWRNNNGIQRNLYHLYLDENQLNKKVSSE